VTRQRDGEHPEAIIETAYHSKGIGGILVLITCAIANSWREQPTKTLFQRC
jgi:hypothetical protein